MTMTITEKRFREASGEQYMATGAVRCQAQSKGRLRKWREEFEDYETPAEDIWPECQCNRSAEPGAFACKWHGGATPKKDGSPPRSLLDVLPVDLASKFKALAENPAYWSRREDILLMQARVWELMEDLQAVAGSEEAWGMVEEALVALRRGDELSAIELLREATSHHDNRRHIWNEIRSNENVIKELTNTQIRTIKDLKQMATTEQVTALVMNLYEIVANGAKEYIDDPIKQSKFLQQLSRAVARFANLSPQAVGYQIGSGRDPSNGEAE